MGPASDNAGYGAALKEIHDAELYASMGPASDNAGYGGIDFSLGAAVVGFNGSGVG